MAFSDDPLSRSLSRSEKTEWWPQVDVVNWHFGWRIIYHNWVEISSTGGTPVVIDPWPSGGENVIDPTYTNGSPNVVRH